MQIGSDLNIPIIEDSAEALGGIAMERADLWALFPHFFSWNKNHDNW